MSIDKESLRASIPIEAFYREYLGEPERRASQGSTYFCKFHDDKKTPNMFVFNDGRFKCFACNAAGDIYTFHQKLNATSFKESFNMLAEKYGVKGGSGKQTVDKKIAKAWPYHDEGGKLLFEVVKTDPKGFLQRSPNGNGGWQLHLKGVRRVVYRLPELLNSEGPVYITEGEKDSDRLAREGFTATTSPGGAGKWREGYNTWLKDRDVVILPDNDEIGMKHAIQVANAIHGLANNVKVVQLPGLEDHGDVSDYLENHSANELLAIVKESPYFEPTSAKLNESIGAELLEWETPILPNKLNTPDIPASILPGWLGNYAEAVSENAQTPSGLAVMIGLATIATCVQKRFEVSPFKDNYSEPLSYWAIVSMEPGSRKTSVLQSMTEPLSEWEQLLQEETEEERIEIDTTRTIAQKTIDRLQNEAAREDDSQKRMEFIREVNQLKADMPPALPALRLWTGDVTPERLQDLMAEQNERMGVLSDEGGIFEIMAGLYNDGRANIDIFLQAHAGRSVRVDRGSRTVIMNKPALSFGLAVQPEVLNELGRGSKKRFRGIGALARFHYLFPASNIGSRDMSRRKPIPEASKTAYRNGLFKLLSIEPNYDECGVELPRILGLSKNAIDAWQNFAQYIESKQGKGRDYESIQDWTGKLPGTALRIAGLFHVISSEGERLEIDLSTIEKAIRICQLLIPHAQHAFGKIGADQSVEDAKAVIGWIKEQGVLTFKRSDCHRAMHGRFQKVDRLVKAMETLKGWNVVSDPESIRGETNRATIYYNVNPALIENN